MRPVVRAIFPAPRPKDGTLNSGIEPASLAPLATNRDPSGNSCTASSFTASVQGSAATARDLFAAPRPQDGTLDFGIALALPAAVATHDDSAEK